MPTIIRTGGGYSVGYDDGHADGYNSGMTNGYSNGYKDGAADSKPHKLAYEYISSTDDGWHTYYSDVCDTANGNSKAIGYMFYVYQQYNFDGTITLQGSNNNSSWANIDSLTASNGAAAKIGSTASSYRYFRLAAAHFSGSSVYKALMYAVKQ
jgi:hypothetical protein